jgi:hypothetical protein
MHAPSEDHMTAVMRILSYLKGAPGKGLTFKKHGNMEVKGFTDADWAGNLIDRSPPLAILHLLQEILSHGEVKNKM